MVTKRNVTEECTERVLVVCPVFLYNFTLLSRSISQHHVLQIIQPFISEPRHPRLSPNNTPIVEQESLSTPEPHLYHKYFYIETTPPSPTPQISQPAGPLKLTGSLGDVRPSKPDEAPQFLVLCIFPC
jgi:hypothetical protein